MTNKYVKLVEDTLNEGKRSPMFDVLQQHFADKQQKVAVAQKTTDFAKLKIKKGQEFRLTGRTSSNIHPSRQGWVAIRPSGRGEIVILDYFFDDGLFVLKDVSNE
jgi:hypothetical protein